MFDLESEVMRGPGSIPTLGNILSLDFFHVVEPLMPILALLPISSSLWKILISKTTRIQGVVWNISTVKMCNLHRNSEVYFGNKKENFSFIHKRKYIFFFCWDVLNRTIIKGIVCTYLFRECNVQYYIAIWRRSSLVFFISRHLLCICFMDLSHWANPKCKSEYARGIFSLTNCELNIDKIG